MSVPSKRQQMTFPTQLKIPCHGTPSLCTNPSMPHVPAQFVVYTTVFHCVLSVVRDEDSLPKWVRACLDNNYAVKMLEVTPPQT